MSTSCDRFISTILQNYYDMVKNFHLERGVVQCGTQQTLKRSVRLTVNFMTKITISDCFAARDRILQSCLVKETMQENFLIYAENLRSSISGHNCKCTLLLLIIFINAGLLFIAPCFVMLSGISKLQSNT